MLKEVEERTNNDDRCEGEIGMQDLKAQTIRGGFAKICAQLINFFLRLGSLMILARLLEPKDFGLVGMVTAFTGVLQLFRDFGLSAATVQRLHVTEEQMSTLFWVNILVGLILGLLTAALAPVVVLFYHEPRLFSVTIVLATGFLFNAAGVQHSALLQRQMRFTALAIINTISLVVSMAIGIGMAVSGYGYWAIVGLTITLPVVSTLGVWFVASWLPGRPHTQVGICSMMRFGGTITSACVIGYVIYNLQQVLIGRFWGADAVGVYSRAYQLINIPTDNLNATVGEVAFPALSRVQNDTQRLKGYFLKGYSIVIAMTVPITIICALFADDLIRVLLGPGWGEATAIFRLLAPTVLIFALTDPLWWLLLSTGLVKRGLHITLVASPLVIASYFIGLPYGPHGVALAYSAVLTLWVIPRMAWSIHGTVITSRDMVVTITRPLLSGLVAAALALGAQLLYGQWLTPLPRLVLGMAILCSAYLGMLMYVMGQKEFYIDLMREMLRRAPVRDEDTGNALATVQGTEQPATR